VGIVGGYLLAAAMRRIPLINRSGALVPPTGSTSLQVGDEVLVVTDPDADTAVGPSFTSPDEAAS
jgi:Trk K+ transport system NAD-binding subunit